MQATRNSSDRSRMVQGVPQAGLDGLGRGLVGGSPGATGWAGHRSLRAQVTSRLGIDYTRGQASYDLRRLRLKGLIVRVPHTNTYVLTPDGQRFAVFYTKVYNRLLMPLMAADRPPAPLEVRQALRVLDHAVTDYIDTARVPAA